MTAIQPTGGAPKPAHGRWQFSLRAMLYATVLASLLASYVGSYYRLSRRGMAEAAEYDMVSFLYVPAAEVFTSKDLSRHYLLCRLYAPLNWVDRVVFGGDYPVGGITFDLS